MMLKPIQRYLRSSPPYALARKIKQRFTPNSPDTTDYRVATLKPQGQPRGIALFSFVNRPFFLKPGEAVPLSHTHYMEGLLIAQILRDLGYEIDVISHRNLKFIPEKDYTLFIDVRRNMERLTAVLSKNCVKVMHLDTAHITFHNAAESKRLLDVQQRRGVTLLPRRYEVPNLGIEHADAAIMLGNSFTLSTYAYAQKPIYPLSVLALISYPWPEDKDFAACRKRFLWFGSGGMIHKGLDLVLDVFAAMPDYHLTVCGPVEEERDFVRAYHKELYETPNIHLFGWIDIDSAEFRAITNQCIGLVYPSCSEGQSGAVITSLHAGLIPLISYESGVDVNDFGVIFAESSIECIKETVQRIGNLPVTELQSMARAAWEYARKAHSKERYASEYRRAIEQIIARS